MDEEAVSSRSGRAKPLAPPERRAALVEATVPLLRTHGLAVTTKDIAQAAGVAEGTIFGVFPDKETLLNAAIDRALDPGPVQEQIAAIDLGVDLTERLICAVEIIQRHMERIWELISSVGLSRLTAGKKQGEKQRGLAWEPLVPLLEPDRAHLSREPAEVARALVGLAWSSTHPMLVGSDPISAGDVVDLVLHGVAANLPAGAAR